MEPLFQKLLRGLRHGRYLFATGRAPIDFMHIPTSIPRGLWTLAQNKAARSKIETGFFKDNLIVVIGVAKAGTKSMVRALRVLQDTYRPLPGIFPVWRPDMTKGRYFDLHGAADLQLEIAIDVLDGGVLHTHSTPNYRSLYVLERLGCKYIVLLRHPLSRLAPIYCSCLQDFEENPNPSSLPKFFLENIYPIRSSVFDGNRNTDEVIRYMIEGGLLEATLFWMTMWLDIRDPKQSIVVKYEDIISKFDTVLTDLSVFNFGVAPDPQMLDACRTTYDEDKQPQSYRYPRGWPGSPEAMGAYFSPENRRLYKEIASRFVETNVNGKRLLEVYPDLIEPAF